MILFKRVRESFGRIEGREWALLLLETLGVLAGILIAFELQEWAQRRSEAAKHRQLMERLFEESQWDVTTLRSERDSMRSDVKTQRDFATILSGGRCPPEPLWKAVSTVGLYPAFEAPRTVYRELMGAGGLSSIGNPETRKQIAIFNSVLEWSQSQNDYFRSFTVQREVVPLDDHRIHLRFEPGADEPEVARYERQALCDDQGFRNRMADAVRSQVVALSWHEDVTGAAIRMCAALGQNIGRVCRPAREGDLTGEDARARNEVIARTSKT